MNEIHVYDGGNRPQLEKHDVYLLGDVMYVPHYIKYGLYVGPGYPFELYTPQELMNAGARRSVELLWSRKHAS